MGANGHLARGVTFFIAGYAKTTQSGSTIRLATGRSIPMRRNPEWSAWCKLVALQHRPAVLLKGPLGMCLKFQMPRLKNEKTMGPYPMGGGDLDNLFKGPKDAWEGILYANDKQVVHIRADKIWAPKDGEPGIIVHVYELP